MKCKKKIKNEKEKDENRQKEQKQEQKQEQKDEMQKKDKQQKDEKNNQRQQYINPNQTQAHSSIPPPPISNQIQACSSRRLLIIYKSQIEPVRLGEIVGAFNDAVKAYNDAKSQTKNPKLAIKLLGYEFFLDMNEQIYKYCCDIELHQYKFNEPEIRPPLLIHCYNSINKHPLFITAYPISNEPLITCLRNCYAHGNVKLSDSTITFNRNGYCQISANSLKFANWLIAWKKEWECKIKTWAKENRVLCL